jgi:YesN/AraC family two-component response regulator
VLLVEDQQSVRDFLSQLLANAGWAVTPVATGPDAIDELSRTKFSVVLCDLDLGREPDGIEVLRRMPARSKGTPFVLLTAHGTIDRCKEALAAGASDFLEKPSSPATVLSTLARVTGQIPHGGHGNDGKDSDTVDAGDRHVRRALWTLSRRFREPNLTVAHIAESTGVSPEHLARLFATHLGRSPLEQLHLTRVRAAEQLLAETDLSIFEIALDCGYRSDTGLNHWFKRLRGRSPNTFRKAPTDGKSGPR